MKANMFNKSWWVTETREKELDRVLKGLLNDAGFNVRDEIECEFRPYGYTKLWLLSESHLAVHTFPEEGATYIELSSCNEQYYINFISEIVRVFHFLKRDE